MNLTNIGRITAVVAATALLPATSAHAVAPASASLGSIDIQLFDIDPLDAHVPAITWQFQGTNVLAWAESPAANELGSTDWVTALAVGDGPANASADASTLWASLAAVPAGSASAWAARFGSFTLTPMTVVVFSAMADTAVAGISGGAIAAKASLFAELYPVGSILQNSGLTIEYGVSPNPGGTIQAFLGNLTTDPAEGSLTAFTELSFTPAIPEPASAGMLLAGLGLLGFAARRNKGG